MKRLPDRFFDLIRDFKVSHLFFRPFKKEFVLEEVSVMVLISD